MNRLKDDHVKRGRMMIESWVQHVKKKRRCAVFLVMLLGLTGCGGSARDALGLRKTAPDEFTEEMAEQDLAVPPKLGVLPGTPQGVATKPTKGALPRKKEGDMVAEKQFLDRINK